MAEHLSTSATFAALNARVTDLELHGVPNLTAASIVAALGYTPANKAGETFGGQVAIQSATDQKMRLADTNNPYIQAQDASEAGLGYLQWTSVDGKANLVGNNGVALWATSSKILDASSTEITTIVPIVAGASGDEKLRLVGSDGPYIGAYNASGSQLGYVAFGTGVAALESASGSVYLRVGGADIMGVNASGAQLSGEFSVTGGIDVSGSVLIAGATAATEDYVDTAIADLVNSAPGTLDTLNELAAALGDDPNFATTMTTLIGTKAALAGAAFTGTVSFGNTNYALGMASGTIPTVQFDVGDYFQYDRAGNMLSFSIATSAYLTVTTAGIFTPGTVTAGTDVIINNDTNYRLTWNGGPTVRWDSGDELVYDRTGNNWTYYIGGVLTASIAAAGISTKGSIHLLSATGAIFVGSPNLFQLQENGSTTGCTIQFDTGASLRYNRPTSAALLQIGGTDQIAFDANSAFGGGTRIGLIGTGTGGSWEFAISIAHKTGDPTDRRLLFSDDATLTPLFSIDKNGDMRVAGNVFASTGPLS